MTRLASAVSRSARPPLFGLAPGGVCPAASVARRAVRSYRTFSPLPRPFGLWHSRPLRGCRAVAALAAKASGIFSVALSLGSPPAAVSRHRVINGARTFLHRTFLLASLLSPLRHNEARQRPSGRLVFLIRDVMAKTSRAGMQALGDTYWRACAARRATTSVSLTSPAAISALRQRGESFSPADRMQRRTSGLSDENWLQRAR